MALMFRVTGTFDSATAILHSATTLLFYVVGTSVQYLDTFVKYYTIPRVPIVLRPSHSLLPVYAIKHLYEKYLIKMMCETFI